MCGKVAREQCRTAEVAMDSWVLNSGAATNLEPSFIPDTYLKELHLRPL